MSMSKITVVGLDLAKNVFQVHGVDDAGQVVCRKQLRRAQVLPFFTRLQPCLIGMEACGGMHYWSRKLSELGHTVRPMAARFIKPYLKSNKNDSLDAEAICEAVQRPSMRFVTPKSPEQQAALHLHHSRRLLVGHRTALINHMRGVLMEFGMTVPVGPNALRRRLPEILEDGDNELPMMVRDLLATLAEQLRDLDARIEALEHQIEAWHRNSEASQSLAEIPGIGLMTATALAAAIGDGRAFRNGRELAAYLGLVPRQDSSGGRQRLLGISKRGDGYLRTLLIHGARAVVRHLRARTAAGKPPGNPWLAKVLERRHPNVAAVALANHNARVAWALLTRQERYRPMAL
jgi:transposase